jgi:NhaP-type Na+/H+ or K+/H+ antiporter
MIFLVTFMVMMLFFFMTGAAGEKYHPPFGHETSYTITFGIIVSLVMWFAVRDSENNAATLSSSFAFKPSFFFDFLLPPLVFSSGYTMHKKKFFDNLGNISLNGFFVTICCFFIYGAGTIIMVSFDLEMTSYYV